ncbi:MAG TPA: flagellar biosynthesis anti-sigma factor FlgM [Bryobacteraceae bacterium]|jgi:flagellar biosynthesis anti-sigma factor FlgM|nr:flagellar biosynthesis anti-sigma factor FlgM [Bryobacteraceae bacterium]
MRINDCNLTPAASSEAGRSAETQKADAARTGQAPAAQSGGDRVEFSGSLGALARAVSSDQANRASRIASLAAQVQSGSYRPDPAAISRGMIAEALAG